ncbi:hypothetical protein B0A55_04857 [Friedmanniomyces simplex]|uniref:Uncharacterized protein n=1 Tax=Friedmanniomyces simplex TaxID=329884 RepID=A0A4U0XKG5_9PEZI|nr:hypothetical protein B0A55_04857 [Friedmanniomyces simplex]
MRFCVLTNPVDDNHWRTGKRVACAPYNTTPLSVVIDAEDNARGKTERRWMGMRSSKEAKKLVLEGKELKHSEAEHELCKGRKEQFYAPQEFATQPTMCREITLQGSCGCKIAAKTPIKHCPDGAKLQFTCKKYNSSIKNTIKKPFECPQCCSKAIQQAQSKLSKAAEGYEAARAGGDDKAIRVAKSVMDRANKGFSGEVSKHDKCAMARHRDKD